MWGAQVSGHCPGATQGGTVPTGPSFQESWLWERSCWRSKTLGQKLALSLPLSTYLVTTRQVSARREDLSGEDPESGTSGEQHQGRQGCIHIGDNKTAYV